MPLLNPLTDVHLECCNQVLQGTPDAVDYAKALEECGIDCSQQMERIQMQDEFMRKVKNKFFPYKP